MNNVKFEECKLSGDMVPYMYGELSVGDCSAFESHLLGCEACTDDFASISSARYEVYDWKKLEFDAFETPQIQIPYDAVPAASANSSWVGKLRSAFESKWSIPGVAFAGLAVVSIFAAIFMSAGDGGGEVASRLDNSNIASVTSKSESDSIGVPATETESRTEAPSEATPRPLQISAPGRVQPRRPVRNDKVTSTRQVEAKQASTRAEQKSIPTLNEFADDEDTSLRLAELFDDIETRD